MILSLKDNCIVASIHSTHGVVVCVHVCMGAWLTVCYIFSVDSEDDQT